jgi:hypothetical protein
MGLQIMRYRAALISATLSIGPPADGRGGTVVNCSFVHPDQFALPGQER